VRSFHAAIAEAKQFNKYYAAILAVSTVSPALAATPRTVSPAENDPPETRGGDGEIDDADDEHRNHRPPDEREVGAAK